MIHESEAQFIQRFIVKNRRERLLFELSGEKRWDGMGRFAHRWEEHFVPGCLHPYKLISAEKLYGDLLALGCAKDGAHIMSFAWDADNEMPLREALERALYGGTLLVLAKDATAAYYETEPDFASKKYLIY